MSSANKHIDANKELKINSFWKVGFQSLEVMDKGTAEWSLQNMQDVLSLKSFRQLFAHHLDLLP